MEMPDRLCELSAWLAVTDIAWLELRGPGTLLRLRRDAPTVVRSPCVGVLRHGHPLHDTPLVGEGERVIAGQALALLQIGPTLVPAPAPRDGVVARFVARDGDAVGYGDPLVELT
jgi:acetyl-CoA carboxylase biotin carboxyl carrier protein